MALFWNWLQGPPFTTVPSLDLDGEDWVLSLPEDPRDRLAEPWMVYVAWGLISFIGPIAMIAVANRPTVDDHSGRQDQQSLIFVILALMTGGYVVSASLSRGRNRRQLLLTGHELQMRRRMNYLGIEWFGLRYRIPLGQLKAIRRESRGLHAERHDGKTDWLMECANEADAEWIRGQLLDRLNRPLPDALIHWTDRNDAIVAVP